MSGHCISSFFFIFFEIRLKNNYKIIKKKRMEQIYPKTDAGGENKQDAILKKLFLFYKQDCNKDIIIPIIKQKTNISLRLLDWLVTNYSEKNNIYYSIQKTSGCVNFNIWLDYKNQLKAYNKSNFDPFCRNQRIYYDLEKDVIYSLRNCSAEYIKELKFVESGFVTTLAQLNFFRWAIKNHVINYASENIDRIESDMLTAADDKKIQRNKEMKRSRTLSKSHSILKKFYIKTQMEFVF